MTNDKLPTTSSSDRPEHNSKAVLGIAFGIVLIIFSIILWFGKQVSGSTREAWKVNAVTDYPQPTLAAEQLTRGQGLYQQFCGQCHGADAEGGLGPDLRQKKWHADDGYTALLTIIADGVPGSSMKPWRHVLIPDDVHAVGSHIMSLEPIE